MRLLVRVDAGAAIGTGHVMRCLSLAQAWQDEGGTVVFLSAGLPLGLRDRLTAEHCEVTGLGVPAWGEEDVATTLDVARREGASWLVIDSYQASASYQRRVKDGDHRLLWIDDLGRSGPYCADLVLNQNAYADPLTYAEREPVTQLLLGNRFVLLRREFGRWVEWNRAPARDSANLLVTMGGADEANVTSRAVEALRTLTGLRHVNAAVVLGADNSNSLAVERAAIGIPGVRIESSVEDMPALMAWADLAVTAGGTTCWELAFMQVPFLAVAVADNQRPLIRRAAEAGIGIGLGWHADLSSSALAAAISDLLDRPEQREEMSRQGRRVVDGRGSRRIVATMLGRGDEGESGEERP